jgi:hypothetical protein
VNAISCRIDPRSPITERVVVNRDSRALPAARRLYPNARIFLWLHDRVSPGSKRARWLASTADVLLETATHIVCVSDYQRREVIATLESIGLRDRLHVSTIYNPVDDWLLPNGTSVDPDKLVFFSRQVLAIPRAARAYESVLGGFQRRWPVAGACSMAMSNAFDPGAMAIGRESGRTRDSGWPA